MVLVLVVVAHARKTTIIDRRQQKMGEGEGAGETRKTADATQQNETTLIEKRTQRRSCASTTTVARTHAYALTSARASLRSLHTGFAFPSASSSARVLRTASAVKVSSQLRNSEPVFVYLILNRPLTKSSGMTCRSRDLRRVFESEAVSFDSLLWLGESTAVVAGGEAGCTGCWCCCADLGAGMVMPLGAAVVVAATAADGGA